MLVGRWQPVAIFSVGNNGIKAVEDMDRDKLFDTVILKGNVLVELERDNVKNCFNLYVGYCDYGKHFRNVSYDVVDRIIALVKGESNNS